jgi:hypothetical protein
MSATSSVRSWVLVLGALAAGACGLVDQARARLDALLADEAPAAPSAPAEPPAAAGGDAAVEGAEPPVVAEALVAAPSVSGGEAGGGEAGGGEASGGEASGGEAGGGEASGGEASDRSSGEAGGGEASGAGTGGAAADGGGSSDTGGVPMSMARGPAVAPTPTPSVEGPTPTPSVEGPTPTPSVEGPTPTPPPVGVPCLEGEWEAEDLHAYFARELTKQAHGRTVRHRGESGRMRVSLRPGALRLEAEHRRLTFQARLANVDIRYTVDVHGEVEAPTRVEAPDVLVVEHPTRSTLRAREVARFSGSKSEARTLAFPVEGRWQATCGPDTLTLRPLEDGKPGPALELVRPRP